MATRSTQVKPKQDDRENVSGGDWETVKPPSEPAPEPSFEDKFRENHPTLASIADTAKSASDAGADVIAGQAKAAIGGGYHVAKFLDHLSKSIMGLPDDGHLPEAVFGSKGAQEQYADAIEPKGAAQKVGAATVDAVPYIAAEGPIAKVASKAADIAPVASRIVGGAAKFAGRFAAGDAIAHAQGAENPELAGAANATLPILFDAAGAGLQKLGTKFQTAQIRPTKADIAAGYDPETLNKFGLSKMSLPNTLEAVHSKIVDLAGQLRDGTKASTETINMNDVINTAKQNLLSRDAVSRTPPAELAHVRTALKDARSWLKALGNPEVTIDEAQTIKRGFGLQGAWEYGKSAADKGSERVANELFSQLKPQIEQAAERAGTNVQAINKQLGDLMPVEQAIIRRIPVAARNNPLSLTDLMLFATGHPAAMAAHVASRTMGGAAVVHGAGKVLSAVAPAAGALTAGAMGSARQRLRGVEDDDE